MRILHVTLLTPLISDYNSRFLLSMELRKYLLNGNGIILEIFQESTMALNASDAQFFVHSIHPDEFETTSTISIYMGLLVYPC